MKKKDIIKNKAICPMPFNHSYIGPTYERRLCCISKNIYSDKINLEDYWNSDKMKKIRMDMVQGTRVSECEVCYKLEDSNIESYRERSLAHDIEVGDEHTWLTEESATKGIASLPTHFDYRTIHCNLACNHCGSAFSSEHLKQRSIQQKNGHMQDKGLSFKIDKDFEETMLNDLIKAVDERRLTRIYFAGGEPMMSLLHWKFLEHAKKAHDTDPDFIKNMNVYYNTNLTKTKWKQNDAYEAIKFLNPKVHASLDGVGNTFNYIRRGADWEQVVKNFNSAHKALVDSNNPKFNFGVQPVILSHNIFSMDEMLSFFEKYEGIEIQPLSLLRNFPNEYHYNPHPGFLDPCEFPSEIMIPAIDVAIERVERSTVSGSNAIIPILENYKIDIAAHRKNNEKLQFKSYAATKHMETLSSLTLNSLLKEINTPAWIWYNSICDKYRDADISTHKLFDNLDL